jgi:hypothetical protein
LLIRIFSFGIFGDSSGIVDANGFSGFEEA